MLGTTLQRERKNIHSVMSSRAVRLAAVLGLLVVFREVAIMQG